MLHLTQTQLQKPITPPSSTPPLGFTIELFITNSKTLSEKNTFLFPTWPDHNSDTEASDKGIGALGSLKFATPFCKSAIIFSQTLRKFFFEL
jgi:hypothetical protein